MIGRVYCLRSHQTTDVYVGSTKRTLSCRMATHRSAYKEWIISNKKYITSYEILKYTDCYIELIEQDKFGSKQEMQKREGHFIREMECVNKKIEGRSKKEWTKDNTERIAERQKKYNIKKAEQNKEKITCSCGSVCTKYCLRMHLKTKKHIDWTKINPI